MKIYLLLVLINKSYLEFILIIIFRLKIIFITVSHASSNCHLSLFLILICNLIKKKNC